MLLVVSPAKKLDYESHDKTSIHTIPDYLKDSSQLIKRLRDFSTLDISELMDVSTKIATLNFDRYAKWTPNFTLKNSKQSILAFKGDVYTGMDALSFNNADFKFAQKHLRILSGLYGLLRPLDLMKAYRLEMGSKLSTTRGKNLYEFWDTTITDGLNEQLKKIKSDVLINLASNEYFKSVKKPHLNANIITPMFKDYKNGDYKMIGIYAKKARGLLSRYIIKNKISNPEDIKNFTLEGYKFNKKLSKDYNWVFTRKLM
ncbi:MAG: peroxide stress protein YaaA [Thiohalomonadales bacterium]